MPVDYVALAAGVAWAALREVCGADEEVVADTSTRSAVALLDRLLVAGSGVGVCPGRAAELTASDRDRLLAAVYQRLFGQRVRSTLSCRNCSHPFDLDFSLPELLANLQAAPAPGVEQCADGSYRLPDGRRFRLPTAVDEFAVGGLPPAEAERALLARCLVEGDPTADSTAVQAEMQRIAPVVDLELETRCPECATAQPVHFGLQAYVLGSLLAARARLFHEVHHLASTYHWPYAEIMGLARSQRRAYLELITAEASQNRKVSP